MPGSNGNSTLTSVFGQGQFNSGSSGSNIPLSSGSSGSSFLGRVGGFFKDFGSPIAEVGAALINNYFAGRRAREANQFSHDERIAQNLWDLEQWNRQNAYDSPAAQMQRLKDAGLNPNLLYGDMTAAIGQPLSHGAAPSGQMAQTFPFSNPLTDVLQARMMRAQIDNIDADTDKKEQETEEVSQKNSAQYWSRLLNQKDRELNIATLRTSFQNALDSAKASEARQAVGMWIEQTEGYRLANAKTKEELKLYPMKLQLAVLDAIYGLGVKSSQIDLNNAEARNARASADYQEIQNRIERAWEDIKKHIPSGNYSKEQFVAMIAAKLAEAVKSDPKGSGDGPGNLHLEQGYSYQELIEPVINDTIGNQKPYVRSWR